MYDTIKEYTVTFFTLSIFTSHLEKQNHFSRRLVLPTHHRPLPPLRTFRPRRVQPARRVIFLQRNMNTTNETTRPQMRRTPPIFTITNITTRISTRDLVPPNKRSTNKVTNNVGMRFRRLCHGNKGSPPPYRRNPNHRLRYKRTLYHPTRNNELILYNTISVNMNRGDVPRNRLNNLIDEEVTINPSIRTRNINARRNPNIRLYLSPTRDDERNTRGRHGKGRNTPRHRLATNRQTNGR